MSDGLAEINNKRPKCHLLRHGLQEFKPAWINLIKGEFVGTSESELEGCAEELFERGPILWVNSFHEQRIGRLVDLRIQPKNPEMLLRPVKWFGGDLPGPTGGVADLLSLGQKSLAPT